MTTNTVAYSDHVCEYFPHHKRSMPKYRNYSKRHCNNPGDDAFLFTCGGCQTKYKTVCLLHIHIDSHQEGGSYSYDHITRTAFPKYDSICAYTQVEEHIFDLIKLTPKAYEEDTYSIGTYNSNLEENADKLTRKSKRIAERKNTLARIVSCSESLKNHADVVNRPESDIGDFPVKTNKYNSQRKIDGTENEIVMNTGTEIKIYNGNPNNRDQIEDRSRGVIGTRDYGKKKRMQKRTNHKNVHSIHMKTNMLANASAIKDSTDIDGQTTNISNSKALEANNEDSNDNEMTGAREKMEMEQVDDLKSVKNKTDEIAASEALIAISIGSNSESNNTIHENARTNDTVTLRDVDTNTAGVKLDVSNFKQDATIPERTEVQIDHRKPAKQDNKGTTTEYSLVKREPVEISRELTHGVKQRSGVHEKYIKKECPTCGKVGSRTMVSYHKYIHKESKELSCDKCGKLFQHPACLKVWRFSFCQLNYYMYVYLQNVIEYLTCSHYVM